MVKKCKVEVVAKSYQQDDYFNPSAMDRPHLGESLGEQLGVDSRLLNPLSLLLGLPSVFKSPNTKRNSGGELRGPARERDSCSSSSEVPRSA
jgi:hypothetical protein